MKTTVPLALVINQYPQFQDFGPVAMVPPPYPCPLAIPKLLVGYRLRSRSVSRDTLLRSTSFLLRNPLSCRASSSSTGHGAPSSSSCGNSSFQSCPPCGRAPGPACNGTPAQQTPRGMVTASSATLPLPGPRPPHQGSYLPVPPSGSPASRGAGRRKKTEREQEESCYQGDPQQKETLKCYSEFC